MKEKEPKRKVSLKQIAVILLVEIPIIVLVGLLPEIVPSSVQNFLHAIYWPWPFCALLGIVALVRLVRRKQKEKTDAENHRKEEMELKISYFRELCDRGVISSTEYAEKEAAVKASFEQNIKE